MILKKEQVNLYKIEETLHEEGFTTIVGLDEAGRGPMAGPLVVAAVVLPRGLVLESLNDSKKVSEKVRDKLYNEIMEKALEVKYEIVSSSEVDNLNIYQATKLAMEKLVRNMLLKVDYVLSDAMKLDISIPYEAIIKGDSKVAAIAAASIIAKVTRDRLMYELDKKHPEYGFKKHKGYVTAAHLDNLAKFGPLDEHRRSFAPVRECIKERNK